jgi:CDP-diacylglycerol--serine O-phosphatidyltransferase
MRPRFVGRLGPADFVTVANAVLGFVAVFVAPGDPRLAARLVLLAAIADGLDGVVARHVRSTPVGKHLDSLADVVSFGVAPALIVTAYATGTRTIPSMGSSPRLALVVGVPGLFVGMVVVRLGLYAAYDADDHYTEGVPSTLAATLIAAAVLATEGAVASDFGPLLLAAAVALSASNSNASGLFFS